MSDETTALPDPEHHRHVPARPPRNPYKIALIVIGVIVGLALIALIVWLAVGRPAPAPTPTPTSSSETPSPSPTPTEPPPAPTACAAADLTVELGAADPAAGTTRVPLIFTNSGTAECTLQGFPAVTFVAGGEQVGAPSTQDTSAPADLVTLAAGQAAQSVLAIATAGDVCDAPVDTDGFSVVPPGSSDPIDVATTDYQACDAPNTSLISVTAVAAG